MDLAQIRSDPGFSSRYELGELLGEGGMGRVYRGIQKALDRTVAIKFLSDDLGQNPKFVARFLAEARLAAGVLHTNVVIVFDSGVAGGVPYLVTELVEGEPLTARLKRGRPERSETVLIMDQVLDGLAAIHRRGIVHRDLKPANILVVPGLSLCVKIVDFGIAKQTGPTSDSDGAPRTAPGAILGTPEFMAPEQIVGDPVSPATDVYAAAIILCLMLTGKHPFAAPTAIKVLQRQLTHDPTFPPDLPAGMRHVLTRGLARLPSGRFPDSLEFKIALREASREIGPASDEIASETISTDGRADRPNALGETHHAEGPAPVMNRVSATEGQMAAAFESMDALPDWALPPSQRQGAGRPPLRGGPQKGPEKVIRVRSALETPPSPRNAQEPQTLMAAPPESARAPRAPSLTRNDSTTGPQERRPPAAPLTGRSGTNTVRPHTERVSTQELVRQLRSSDENERLRAATALSQGHGDDLRIAVPSLRDALVNDPNPAVRYLAAKSLRAQGIDPAPPTRDSQLLVREDDRPAAEGGLLELQGGVQAFWRVAQEYLRTPMANICLALQANESLVSPWVIRSADGLGLDLLLPHLIEFHQAAGGDATSPTLTRLLEVATRWHSEPRTSLFPAKSDIRGEGLAQVLRTLSASPDPFVRAVAVHHVEPCDTETAESLVEQIVGASPLVADSLAGALMRTGRRRHALGAKIAAAAERCLSRRPSDRSSAALVRLISALAPSRSEPLFRFLSDVDSCDTRAALADALARAPMSAEEKGSLGSPMLQAPSPLVISRAIVLLWPTPQKALAVSALASLVRHPDASVRTHLACALAEISDRDNLDCLETLLSDPERGVRRAALRSLACANKEAVLALSMGLSGHAKPELRAASFHLLVAVSDRELLASLRQGLSLRIDPPELSVEAKKGPMGISMRIPLLDSSTTETTLSALETLGESKSVRLVEKFIVESDPWVRALSSRILWKLGELWAVDTVSELLTDRDAAAWEAGIEALSECAAVSRIEARLAQYHLLRASLRRHPGFETSGPDESTR